VAARLGLAARLAALGLAALGLGLAALRLRLAALGLGLAAGFAALGLAALLFRDRHASLLRAAGVASGNRLAALFVLRTALLHRLGLTTGFTATMVVAMGFDNIVFVMRHLYVYLGLIENLCDMMIFPPL